MILWLKINMICNEDGEPMKQKNSCSSPPPRCSPPPSMNSFTIPKRIGIKELLQSIPLDSRECKEVINVFYNSLWSPQSYTFEFKYCDLVNNDKLEDEFKAKRKEMGKDIKTGYAFLHLNNKEECKYLCENGLSTLSVHNSSTGLIGDHRYGIYLSRCADIVNRRAAIDEYSQCTIIVFKILMGRLRLVDEQKSSEDKLEPTPDFDAHISKSFQRGKKRILSETFDSSQIYFYEINLDNISIDDDAAIYSKRPRQCLPYAVLTFEAKRKMRASVMTPLRHGRSETNLAKPLASDSQLAENPHEHYLKHFKYVWSGSFYLKEHFLADVRLGMYNEKLSPMSPLPASANLCISQKIAFEKLARILPARIFRKKPCESQQPTSLVEDFHFLHTELYPCDHYENKVNRFHKQLQKKREAGVCTFNSGMKLYILPSCDFTDLLGITTPLYPAALHCLFMHYKPGKQSAGKTEYEYFVKQSAAVLRDRASENEELKLLHCPPNATISNNLQWSYKPDDRIKIFRLLTLITKANDKLKRKEDETLSKCEKSVVDSCAISNLNLTKNDLILKKKSNLESSCLKNLSSNITPVQDTPSNLKCLLNNTDGLATNDNDSICSDDLVLDVDDVPVACCEDPLCKEHFKFKPKLFKGFKISEDFEYDDSENIYFTDFQNDSDQLLSTDQVTNARTEHVPTCVQDHPVHQVDHNTECVQQSCFHSSCKVSQNDFPNQKCLLLIDNQDHSNKSKISNQLSDCQIPISNNDKLEAHFLNKDISIEAEGLNINSVNKSDFQINRNDNPESFIYNKNMKETDDDVPLLEMSVVDEYIAESEEEIQSNKAEVTNQVIKEIDSSFLPTITSNDSQNAVTELNKEAQKQFANENSSVLFQNSTSYARGSNNSTNFNQSLKKDNISSKMYEEKWDDYSSQRFKEYKQCNSYTSFDNDPRERDLRHSRSRSQSKKYPQDVHFNKSSYSDRSRSRSPRQRYEYERNFSRCLKRETFIKSSEKDNKKSNKSISVESKPPRIIERDLGVYKSINNSKAEVDFQCGKTISQPALKQKRIEITSTFDKEAMMKKNQSIESSPCITTQKYQNGSMSTGYEACEYNCEISRKKETVHGTELLPLEPNVTIDRQKSDQVAEQNIPSGTCATALSINYQPKDNKATCKSSTVSSEEIKSVNLTDCTRYKSLDLWGIELKNEELDTFTKMFLSEVFAKLEEK